MKNYLKLFGIFFSFYLFFAHFTPFILQYFPNWQAYIDKADELGIDPGALYYTDVHVVADAEKATRKAVIDAYGDIWGYSSEKKSKEISKDEQVDKAKKDDSKKQALIIEEETKKLEASENN